MSKARVKTERIEGATDQDLEAKQELFSQISQFAHPVNGKADNKVLPFCITSDTPVTELDPRFFFKVGSNELDVKEEFKEKKLEDLNDEVSALCEKYGLEFPKESAQFVEGLRDLILNEIAPRSIAVQVAIDQSSTALEEVVGELQDNDWINWAVKYNKEAIRLRLVRFFKAYYGLTAEETMRFAEQPIIPQIAHLSIPAKEGGK